MRTAYVSIDSGDARGTKSPLFTISPMPFLFHEGEIQLPVGEKIYGAESYSALCAVLKGEFQIPDAMLPPARYFKPKKTEKLDEEGHTYRTVPEGAGEPAWRTKARQAVMWAIDEPDRASSGDYISVNGRPCYSMEELQSELEAVAEGVGGKKKIKGTAYEPDYDVLVKEVLSHHPYVNFYGNVLKQRKRMR